MSPTISSKMQKLHTKMYRIRCMVLFYAKFVEDQSESVILHYDRDREKVIKRSKLRGDSNNYGSDIWVIPTKM